jgi:two-component system nitrogen regulation sensor histidine kinase GlnL
MVTGNAQGTGLGLSIAQRIANQHGGLIQVQSVPGETRFTMLLPMEI